MTDAVSIVVALHESSRQAENALFSLSTAHQRNVTDPYEIILVEALSDDVLGEARARAFGDNVKYFQVPAGAAWRVRSITKGLEQARAPLVGVLQDAAHIVTPRVVEHAINASREYARAVVLVADYALDPSRVPARGNADAELEWFAASGWREAPYSLFDNVVFGPACCNGPLSPVIGAIVLFFEKARLSEIAGLHPALDMPGTGALRLQLFTQLCRLPRTQLIALCGEGAFRQTHPEVATESVRWQEGAVVRLMVEAVVPQGPGFQPVHREPVPFGDVPAEAERHVLQSAALAAYHCAVCVKKGEPSWYEDPAA